MSEEVGLSYRFPKTQKIVHYRPSVLGGILQPAIFPWVLTFVFFSRYHSSSSCREVSSGQEILQEIGWVRLFRFEVKGVIVARDFGLRV